VEFEVDHSTPAEIVEQYFFRMQDILGTSNEKWNRSIVGARQAQNGQPSVPGGVQPSAPAGVPPASSGRP
jgi:hypothetical protein